MTTRGRLRTGGAADDRIARDARVRTLIAAEPLPSGVEPAAVSGWLLRLCAASVRAVPTSGAVVTVETGDGVRAVAAASDRMYGVLDEMQSTVGEGPSVQAFATRRPVLGADLSDRTGLGWPAFSMSAHAVGVEAAFAFPLQIVTTRTAELVDVAAVGLLLADAQGRLQFMAASDEQTKLLELFQVQHDEGPCLDAYVSRAPVVVADLRLSADRWPSSRHERAPWVSGPCMPSR